MNFIWIPVTGQRVQLAPELFNETNYREPTSIYFRFAHYLLIQRRLGTSKLGIGDKLQCNCGFDLSQMPNYCSFPGHPGRHERRIWCDACEDSGRPGRQDLIILAKHLSRHLQTVEGAIVAIYSDAYCVGVRWDMTTEIMGDVRPQHDIPFHIPLQSLFLAEFVNLRTKLQRNSPETLKSGQLTVASLQGC